MIAYISYHKGMELQLVFERADVFENIYTLKIRDHKQTMKITLTATQLTDLADFIRNNLSSI